MPTSGDNMLNFPESPEITIQRILEHTDFFIVVKRNSRIGAIRGSASGIFVSYCDKIFFVTCSHCIIENSLYYTGATRGENQSLNEKVPPLDLIKKNPELDIAILSYRGDLSKTNSRAYFIDNEKVISLDRTKRNIGNAGYICGFPEFLSNIKIKVGDKNDSIVAYNKYYSGMGKIIRVDENMIVCDFAEQEFLFNYVPEVSPTGGERDIRGMSGSGLWVYDELTDSPNLLGILLGKNKDSNPQKEHLIEFTPVWKLVEFLIDC